jgi:hypothetical protein
MIPYFRNKVRLAAEIPFTLEFSLLAFFFFLCYLAAQLKFKVSGKLVKFQHGPATVISQACSKPTVEIMGRGTG